MVYMMMIYDMILMMPRHGIFLYIIWWFLYEDEKSWGHGDSYVVLWAPMDGLVIEVAYGEIMVHSTEPVVVVISVRVVGVFPWHITHSRHTKVNISVGTIYDIFWFLWYKNLYVLCFQIYMYYKRNNGDLWLRPGLTIFRESFRSLMNFKEKVNP